MPIKVVDPYGVTSDPQLATLPLALDPAVVRREFKRKLPLLAGPDAFVRPQAIRVVRYRPAKRCLIEYDVDVEREGIQCQRHTVLGKLRARHFGSSDFWLLHSLRQAGLDSASEDGICVPRPIGVLPRFRMWLQCKVPGDVATDLLGSALGVPLARRIAEAAHKLHQAGVATTKRHTMADELRILKDCLVRVAQEEPRWSRRLERVLEDCQRLAARTRQLAACGSHRDFYADQIIVSGRELYLIDFDLYCRADPGLDIGNFLGHVTEQSLRECGDPTALRDVERALEERYVELAGEEVRPAVGTYALLTLVRHIYLSTRYPERRSWTESLLELCEQRLGVAQRRLQPAKRMP